MLETVCRELNNFFEQKKIIGKFEIIDGQITQRQPLTKNPLRLQEDQYFRIVGSVFNDGVYQYPTTASQLKDEEFNGAVWAMAVPKEFLDLVKEIEAWQKKNGSVDSAAMSPFQSESFGGYSYSKGARQSSSDGKGASYPTWQSVYADRLNVWRKARCRY